VLAGMSFDEFAMSSLMTLRNNRGMGQVATSFDLCREMISHIPTKVLKNPKSRYMDPCCGNGSFIIVLIEVLSKWHSPKQISKMIVGCDIDPTNIATARIMIGDKYDIQLISCDSLRYNWDMKAFDVVIMNPPYNDNVSSDSSDNNHRHAGQQLHTVFIDMFRHHCDQLLVVCPVQKWFLGKSKIKANILPHLNSVNIILKDEAEKIFNAKTGTLGVLDIRRKNVKQTSLHLNSEFVATEVITESTIFTASKDVRNIINKMSGTPSVSQTLASDIGSGPVSGLVDKAITPTGKYKCIKTIGKVGQDVIIHKCNNKVVNAASELYVTAKQKYRLERDIDKFRIGFNQAGTPGSVSMKVIPANVVTSYAIGTFTLHSEKEANNFLHYCETKLVRFIIKWTHTSKNNSKQTFKYVPQVDLNRSWTDKELYKHFKLTKAEIKLIEDTVK
jgi:hypothetical protein